MASGGIDPTAGVRRLFRPLSIAASGLSAQRARMDAIAENVANAESTRTAEGGPYQRRIVELQARRAPDASSNPFPTLDLDLPPLPFEEPAGGVSVLGAGIDATEGPLVYDPGHPDADQAGYVRMPNVDVTQETVDMMIARRAYEANATVFQVLKAVLRRALEI